MKNIITHAGLNEPAKSVFISNKLLSVLAVSFTIRTWFICMFIMLLFGQLNSQSVASAYDTLWFGNPYVNSLNNGEACYALIPKEGQPVIEVVKRRESPNDSKIEGMLRYDYDYRSYIDAPFFEHDAQRHSTMVSLKYDGIIPLEVDFVIARSNSAFFKNYFDLSVRFDQKRFQKRQLDELSGQVRQSLTRLYAVVQIVDSISNSQQQIQELSQVVSGYSYQQQREALLTRYAAAVSPFMQNNGAMEREAAIRDRVDALSNATPQFDSMQIRKILDSLNISSTAFDSLEDSVITLLKKEKDLLVISKSLSALEKKRDKVEKMISDSLQKIVRMVEAKGVVESRSSLRELDTAVSNKKGLVEIIGQLQRLNFGGSSIDYSNLTFNQFPVFGLNIKTGTRSSVELALGVSTMLMRSFLHPGGFHRYPLPPIGGIKVPIFLQKKGGFYLIGFYGKQFLNYPNFQSVKLLPSFGWSLLYEKRLASAGVFKVEVAKSNINQPLNGLAPDKSVGAGVFSFGKRGNEAVGVSYQGRVAPLAIDLNGNYTRMGGLYNSPSFYANRTLKESFSITASKRMFSNQAEIRASVQKNNFSYPELQNFSMNTVLVQAIISFRRPKWPMATFGYLPCSQILSLSTGEVVEYNFQTLMGNVIYTLSGPSTTHSFVLQASSVVSNQRNSMTLARLVNQNAGIQYQMALKQLSLFADLSLNKQFDRQFVGSQLGMNWVMGKHFVLGIAGKYFALDRVSSVFGYKVNMGIREFKFGQLQINIEKQLLPVVGLSDFRPITIGRVSFIKKLKI